mmetsp:Transcript_23089/g.55244  ORF Transcript_23089/g.55244 Transcript_23089/m.55244 type:complete len:106 (+) Transcript_23089:713-1030(+)
MFSVCRRLPSVRADVMSGTPPRLPCPPSLPACLQVCLENDDVDAAKSYLREAEGLGFAPDYFTWSVFAAEAARIGDTETMCWAVPKARASSRDPSRYVPPAEFLE